MASEPPCRLDRFHLPIKKGESRTGAQLDRDRILYSEYFRRLAGVTQVVSAAEGQTFHNRLTHSLKVAQLARRMTEKFVENDEYQAAQDHLNPDVAEAAGLIHDLGHPPFGHIAEAELHRLVKEQSGGKAGYQGNAQGFRIITRLDVNDEVDKNKDSASQHSGLNLTRATLDASTKYPYAFGIHDPEATANGPPRRPENWGVYDEDLEVFQWMRGDPPGPSGATSLEAQIMDWADDISFSVHDTEDFYNAGLIPLDRLFSKTPDSREIDYILASETCRKKLEKVLGGPPDKLNELLLEQFKSVGVFADLCDLEPMHRFSHSHLKGVKVVSSHLIGRFIKNTTLDVSEKPPKLKPTTEDRKLTEVLKQLTWRYVIENDALAHQQDSQRKIIEFLFKSYLSALEEKAWHKVPRRFQILLKVDHDAPSWRTAADIVASLTDSEAYAQYHQKSGMVVGSGLRGAVR